MQGASCLPASRPSWCPGRVRPRAEPLCCPHEPAGAGARGRCPLVSSVLGCGPVSVHSPARGVGVDSCDHVNVGVGVFELMRVLVNASKCGCCSVHI